MARPTKSGTKRKNITFRTDEKIINLLDILAQSSEGIVKVESRGHLIELLIKSFCYQVLNGYDTFLGGVDDVKRELNKKGYNEKTISPMTSDAIYEYVKDKSELEELKNQVTEYKKDVEDLRKTGEYLYSSYKELKSEKDKLEDEKASLVNEIKALEKKREELKKEIPQAKANFRGENQNSKTSDNNSKAEENKKREEVKKQEKAHQRKMSEALEVVEGIKFIDTQTNKVIKTLANEDYQSELIDKKCFVTIDKNGNLEITRKTIGVLKHYVGMTFDKYDISNATVSEIADNLKDYIIDDGNGNYYYKVEMVRQSANRYPDYALPEGIKRYAVFYISSNTGKVIISYMNYDDKPIKEIDMKLVDYLIDLEAKENDETYKDLYKSVHREKTLEYMKIDISEGRTPMIVILEDDKKKR